MSWRTLGALCTTAACCARDRALDALGIRDAKLVAHRPSRQLRLRLDREALPGAGVGLQRERLMLAVCGIVETDIPARIDAERPQRRLLICKC